MNSILKRIKTECTEFLDESKGNYAHKPLMFDGRFIKRVKVRKKANRDGLADLFDEAFDEEYRDIMGRSIFCNGVHGNAMDSNRDDFYVFPINGFRTLYNPEIDYYKEYQRIYQNLQNTMDSDAAKSTFVDMIEYSYKKNDIDLAKALFSGNEIIFYGIPYFFAISRTKHPDYGKLLKMIYDS